MKKFTLVVNYDTMRKSINYSTSYETYRLANAMNVLLSNFMYDVIQKRLFIKIHEAYIMDECSNKVWIDD